MSELLPCPFCAAAPPIHIDANEYIGYYIHCPMCGACGPEVLTLDEAIAAWNRRVSEKVGE